MEILIQTDLFKHSLHTKLCLHCYIPAKTGVWWGEGEKKPAKTGGWWGRGRKRWTHSSQIWYFVFCLKHLGLDNPTMNMIISRKSRKKPQHNYKWNPSSNWFQLPTHYHDNKYLVLYHQSCAIFKIRKINDNFNIHYSGNKPSMDCIHPSYENVSCECLSDLLIIASLIPIWYMR